MLHDLIQTWRESGELNGLFAEFQEYASGIVAPPEVSVALRLTSAQIRSSFDTLFVSSTFRLRDTLSDERNPTVTEAIDKFRSRIGQQYFLESILEDVQMQDLTESELATELKRVAGNELWKRGRNVK